MARMIPMKWALRVMLALAIAALAGSAVMAAISGAGHSGHGWLLTPFNAAGGKSDRLLLWHLPSQAPAGAVAPVQRLSERPVLMSAWRDQLVLVYAAAAAQGDSTKRLRAVRALRVTPSPAPGLYFYTPRNRLEALPALPGWGELLGVVMTSDGPVALLRSSAKTDDAQDDASSIATDKTQVRLLRLGDVAWEELNTPAELAPERIDRVLAVGDSFGVVERAEQGAWRLWTIRKTEPTPADHAPEISPIGEPGKLSQQALKKTSTVQWESSPIALGKNDVAVVSTGDELVAISRSSDDEVALRLLRGGRSFELATVADVPVEFAAIAVGRTVVLAWPDTSPLVDRPHVVSISSVTGRTVYEGASKLTTPVTASDIRMLALLLGSVALTIVIFVLKPAVARSAVTKLPPDASLADAPRRLMAGVVDLAPGVVIASRVWHVGFGEVLTAPLTAMSSPGVWPLVGALGMLFMHCALSEWLWGRTLGKVFTGCRTISAAGGRLTFQQAVWRNALKAMYAPLLTLLIMLEPGGRHAADLIAGTMVIVDAEESGEQGSGSGSDADDGGRGGA